MGKKRFQPEKKVKKGLKGFPGRPGEIVPGIPGACGTGKFTYLVRGPWRLEAITGYRIWPRIFVVWYTWLSRRPRITTPKNYLSLISLLVVYSTEILFYEWIHLYYIVIHRHSDLFWLIVIFPGLQRYNKLICYATTCAISVLRNCKQSVFSKMNAAQKELLCILVNHVNLRPKAIMTTARLVFKYCTMLMFISCIRWVDCQDQ